MIHAFLAVVSLLFVPAFAQEKPSAPPSAPKQPAVSVPIFPNPSCPIMGKPISTKLFTDTEMGRIYVCCKSCFKDVLADVPIAYRTAYPTDKKSRTRSVR